MKKTKGRRVAPDGLQSRGSPQWTILACSRAAAEADDVAIRVLDIEVLRAPLGRRDRLDDRDAVGDALLVARFDAVHARCYFIGDSSGIRLHIAVYRRGKAGSRQLQTHRIAGIPPGTSCSKSILG